MARLFYATIFLVICFLTIWHLVGMLTGQPATPFVWFWAIYGQVMAAALFLLAFLRESNHVD